MITPKIIHLYYAISSAFIILGIIFSVVGGIFSGTFEIVILAPILGCIFIIMNRIGCELVMVAFSINDNLKKLVSHAEVTKD